MTAVYESIVVLASILIAIGMVVAAWQLADSRKAKAAVTQSKEYSRLADEYRRLSEVAITAQEHIDFKLQDTTAKLDSLRDQVDAIQRILKEVE